MKFNVHPILEASRAFYKAHGLSDWAEQLGAAGTMSEADAAKVIWAEKNGWTEVVAFPPFATQMADFERLLHETARKPAPHLSDDQQYHTEPFLADDWTKTANGRVLQRRERLGQRESGPYLLLFGLDPPVSAWGRNGKQLAALLESKGLEGLTAPEYLVMQRLLGERDGHHLFYRGDKAQRRGHWLWLVDSADDARMTVATWVQGGVNLQACPLTHRDAKRATIAALIVPLTSRRPCPACDI
jgi:hypothetical protein